MTPNAELTGAHKALSKHWVLQSSELNALLDDTDYKLLAAFHIFSRPTMASHLLN